jgi:hypothetical protein
MDDVVLSVTISSWSEAAAGRRRDRHAVRRTAARKTPCYNGIMIAQPLFATLSDDQLLAETKRLVSNERAATAALLQSLMEVDSRRLYLREGCSSLFTYCTQVLHLAEGAAYNRIEAARAARRCPAVLTALAAGAVTLTSIRLLAPHLTDDNHLELEAARHKRKREVELLIATLRPKPAAPTVIRKLPGLPSAAPCGDLLEGTHTTSPREGQPATRSLVPGRVEARQAGTSALDRSCVQASIEPRTRVASVEPLSTAHYKLQVTIPHETDDKLRRAQDLLRHTLPNGDMAAVLDRALTLLLADLERRRCAATPAPRVGSAESSRTRYIPAAVRREVWRRDQGRCAFVGTSGRCRETGFLEFHHVEPFAEGGLATVVTIQLRCHAHNLYEASLFFGDGGDYVREAADAKW